MKSIKNKIYNKILLSIKKKFFCNPELDALQQDIHIIHGNLQNVEINLISIMRDEEFYLEAFFSHYRKLGVEQFIILDDRSIDGTLNFLMNQKDCVVLRTKYKFGDKIKVKLPNKKTCKKRAGILARSIIARKYCDGKYGLIVDADEFLILPSKFETLNDLYSHIKSKKICAVTANMIDFYPENINDLNDNSHPKSFSELIKLYPFFDAIPLLKFNKGTIPQKIGDRASHRLITQFENLAYPFQDKKKSSARTSLKFPIVLWGKDAFLDGSHRANTVASNEILLALAHFAFTHDFISRTKKCAERGEHAKNSSKYKSFLKLIDHMTKNNSFFTFEKSEKYIDKKQLENLNLLGRFIEVRENREEDQAQTKL